MIKLTLKFPVSHSDNNDEHYFIENNSTIYLSSSDIISISTNKFNETVVENITTVYIVEETVEEVLEEMKISEMFD